MDLSTAIPVWDIAARLAAAAVCGAALGFDREIRGKAAGLRTHTLVAISAAVTTLVALELYWGMAGRSGGGRGEMDPTRVIQGVAQAIGFISAGVMFRAGTTVRGATTAAVIWMAGALGIACGAGFYVLAGMALALCLAVTIIFSYVLRWLPDSAKHSDPVKPGD